MIYNPKKSYGIAGVITLMAMMIVGCLSVEQSCNLLAEKQTKNWVDLKPITSNNFNALAKLDAHLNYQILVSQGTFMPLNLVSVEAEQIVKTNQTLVLHTDCAKLEFEFAVKPNGLVFGTYVYIELVKPNLKQLQCVVSNPGDIRFNSASHYSCNTQMTLSCFSKVEEEKIHVADLVIDGFEFETFQDSNDYKKGEFSLPARTCSIM